MTMEKQKKHQWFSLVKLSLVFLLCVFSFSLNMGSTHAQMRLITINIIHIFELIILQQQQEQQQQQLNDNQHGERKKKKHEKGTEKVQTRTGRKT